LINNRTKLHQKTIVTCKFFKISVLHNVMHVVLRLLAVSSKWWKTCRKENFRFVQDSSKEEGKKGNPCCSGNTPCRLLLKIERTTKRANGVMFSELLYTDFDLINKHFKQSTSRFKRRKIQKRKKM